MPEDARLIAITERAETIAREWTDRHRVTGVGLAVHELALALAESEALVAARDQQIASLQREWQPIETAPKDGNWMIVFRGVIGVGYYFTGNDGSEGWITRPYPNRAMDGVESLKPPTHWMPLPNGPADV